MQEIKAKLGQIPEDLLNPKGYLSYFNPAVRPGYAGTAVYIKEKSLKKPLKVEKKIGFKRFDEEGRVLKLKFPKFTLFNFYIPHGGRDKAALPYKLEAYSYLFKKLSSLEGAKLPPLLLVGDFNVAHKEIDLARPKDNKNNIMFTPEERKQIDKLIELGFTDTFREFNKEGGNYSWWPYFANARARNLGWRIDYCFTSKNLTPKLKNGFILPDVMGSDHCPLGVEINI